jgi:hypothetical protein
MDVLFVKILNGEATLRPCLDWRILGRNPRFYRSPEIYRSILVSVLGWPFSFTPLPGFGPRLETTRIISAPFSFPGV